jgi:leucyl/phenylalanyl-tRNA---protein transferase
MVLPVSDGAGWDATPTPVGESRWAFPPPESWANDDLVGSGADLEPSTLINAYSHGVFPMGIGRGGNQIGWWSPDPRGVLPLDGLRVTRSMRQSAKQFTVRIDTNFEAVMRACAAPTREGAWINKHFLRAYTALHQLGWAHSVETYNDDGHLVGGLYGVRINGFFAGESMFHLQRDASKVALMHLVQTMRECGMRLLDVQWTTPHLASLGVVDIPRAEYLALLARAVAPSVIDP